MINEDKSLFNQTNLGNIKINMSKLNEIRDECLFDDAPEATIIYPLVQATFDFINQTNPDFQKMRDKQISKEEILNWINRIAEAITKVAEKIANKKMQNESINTALEECKTQIYTRMSNLRNSQDRIYKIYLENDNQLKPIMQQHTQAMVNIRIDNSSPTMKNN